LVLFWRVRPSARAAGEVKRKRAAAAPAALEERALPGKGEEGKTRDGKGERVGDGRVLSAKGATASAGDGRTSGGIVAARAVVEAEDQRRSSVRREKKSIPGSGLAVKIYASRLAT
jgi:hypothetical protein